MNERFSLSAEDELDDASDDPLADARSPSVPQPARIGITTRDIDWRAITCDCELPRPRYVVWERREGLDPLLVGRFWEPEGAISYAAELKAAGRDAVPLPDYDRIAP